MSPAAEPMLTIRPPVPCAAICWATCLPMRNWLLSVTASTRSHSSSVMSKMCLLSEIATLLTRISMRPKRSTTALTRAATSLPLETSAMNSSASPLEPLIAPTTRSPRGLSTSTIAAAIRARRAEILAANAKDVAEAKAAGATAAFLDRLALDERRIAAMADGLDVVRALADPVGVVAERWTRPNGMTIERVRVPIGVVGIIYESRPNVTADAAALCLKAGNAAILRGGSESHRSNQAIHAALIEGMRTASLPEAAISLVPTRDRSAVRMMLAGLDGAIDVSVPLDCN